MHAALQRDAVWQAGEITRRYARTMAEVVIVGGGIAGAALAYFLGARGHGDVMRLERETQPGQHATGRSAAVLVELDPHPTLERLKIASAPFLREPPAGFCETRLLDPTGILLLAGEPPALAAPV